MKKVLSVWVSAASSPEYVQVTHYITDKLNTLTAHGPQLFPAFSGSNSDRPRGSQDPCAADRL